MSNQSAPQPHPPSGDYRRYAQPGVQQSYPTPGVYPPFPQTETNIFAILALVLGFFTGILGIVFGHIALYQIQRTGQAGKGMALAGLVIGYFWLLMAILGVIGLFVWGSSDVVSWPEI